MPIQLTAYKVFIASAGGLDEFRQKFREIITHFNETEAHHRGYTFHPVGWEETIGGPARAQALINEDLKKCDYAVFMFRNRWGTPPDNQGKYTSGTEEEWEIAIGLHKEQKILDIQTGFFKPTAVMTQQEIEQLNKVLAFKNTLEQQRTFFFRRFNSDDEFSDWLRSNLSAWLRKIETNAKEQDDKKAEDNNRKLSEIEQSISELGTKPNDYTERVKKILELINKGKPDVALGFVWQLEQDFSTFPEIHVDAAHLLAYVYGILNQPDKVIATYDALIDKYSPRTEAGIIEPVAQAMFNKGNALGRQGQSTEAIATYDALIDLYSHRTEAGVIEPVARAMLNKGVTLSQQGKPSEEIATYDALIAAYGSRTEADVIERVANAMLNKGATLGQQDKPTEQIATYDALIAAYGSRTEAGIAEPVAQAMFSKGVTLRQQGKPTEEIATYDALIAQYRNRTEAGIAEPVAQAFNNKGFRQLLSAKAVWGAQSETQNERVDLLAQAKINLEQAALRSPNNPMVLGNQAYVAWLLGEQTVAEAKFSEALRAEDGGEVIYKGTLADLDVHPIDADAGFRALIERLWQTYQATQSQPKVE